MRRTTGHRAWARGRRGTAFIVVAVQLAALLTFVIATTAPASAGPPTAMTGYVPLPADMMRTAFAAINAAAGTTLDYTVGITNASDGAVITYDHWEDGYDPDISNPVQASTEVWGDGNVGNGDASTVCSTCGGDLLTAGDVFVLRNNISTPRDSTQIRWDGGDKVGSTRGFTLTAGGWTTAVGSLLASAVSAFDTSRYGKAFVVPVGQNTPVPTGSSPPFEYTGASIMAAQSGTVVQVDSDNDGTYDANQTLAEGKAMFVNGGLREGARIVASKPVQVHLMTGDVGATYEAHSFTLFPTNLLTNTYVDPVGSSVENQETIIYLFNPNPGAITVTPTCASCAGSIPVAANTSASFTVPLGEAVQFSSGGPDFLAVGAMGSQSGVGPLSDASSTYDWGFTLVPADVLTSQIVMGWAPGASDVPPSSAADDPVWVTSFAATTLHVDFDADPGTGPLDADCVGKHNLEIPVGALASTRITDPSDNSMTGARVYTCDGTAIAAAWGEDPDKAPVGSPGLDAGYAVIPTTTMLVNKSSSLAIDSNGDAKFGPGDDIQYTVAISNVGGLAFTNVVVADSLMAGLTYVPGSTTFDAGGAGGVGPIADDIVPPAATAFPLDGAGLGVPADIEAGATAYVRFRVKVEDPYPTSSALVSNRVDVTSPQGSGNSTDDLQLATSDLSLTKTETASPAFVGQNAVFSITVTNHGPDTAPAVEVADLLPAGTAYQAHTATTGSYSETTGLWSVGDLANNASATLDITARVDVASAQNFAQVTKSGAVDPDSQPAEDTLGPGNPPNQDDEDRASVSVAPSADLSLTKTRTGGPDELGVTAFRLSLANGGPSTATGVQVTELPPAGAAFVSATASQGSFDSATNVWTVGSMLDGAAATLDVNYTIASFPATNDAQVSAVNETDPDSVPAENVLGPDNPPDQDDESSVTVTPSADVSLTKAKTSSPQFVGDDATFELTVTNDGPDVAASVRVTDLLPTGLAHVSHAASKGSYDPLTGAWTVGAIQVGTSETLTITARVTASGSITNTAEVAASGAPDPDSTPGNGDPNEDDQASATVDTTGGSLGDTVFFDVNGDGNPDAGEPGIAGVGVMVTGAGPNGTLGDGDDVVLPTVTTDASGLWTVSGLGPGSYRVGIDTATLPAGLASPTHDLDGVASANTTDVTLTSGQARTDVDFGYTGTASVGDTIFLDDNGDGLFDPGEGVAGVKVDLVWGGIDGVLGTGDDVAYITTTDASGVWLVEGLPAGLVQVSVDAATLPPGVVNSFDPDGGNDSTSQLALVPGVNDATQDFGFRGNGAVGQVIFRDDNGNGVATAGEGLAGVKVQLVWAGPDGVIGNGDDRTSSAVTAATGAYLITSLPAGLLRVSVMTDTLPTGATNSVDPDGAKDSKSQLTLAPGATDLGQNFGYVVPKSPAAKSPAATSPAVASPAVASPAVASPAVASPAAGGALAFTGSSLVGQLTFLGALLALVGLAFVVMSRRRARPAA